MAIPTTRQLLTKIFNSVELNRDGTISAVELEKAMKNGSMKSFDGITARMMIAMFDKRDSRTLDFEEFSKMWHFQDKWQTCFYDTTYSVAIDQRQFTNALKSLGYFFSPPVVAGLMCKFDSRKDGTLKVDDFLKCGVLLSALDVAFKDRDTDQGREITIAFEDLLDLIITKILV